MIFGHSTFLPRIPRHDGRSIIRSRRSYARASICIWNGSDAEFPVLIRTPASGRPINERPMSAIGIYNAVRRRTKKAFGFAVNLHRFRHAAASFWSIRDPVNVRGVKDLLGQASFGITEKHYIMAQSRLAGRALAHAVDAARK